MTLRRSALASAMFGATLLDLADAIETASSGSIKATVFPSGPLGKGFDPFNRARDDIADATHVELGCRLGRSPFIAAAPSPGAFGGGERRPLALDGGWRNYPALETKGARFGFDCIDDPDAPPRATKITVASELKAVKVGPARSAIADSVKTLGGAATPSRGDPPPT